MTRSLPWLVELMPDMYAEIDDVLAADKGIANGDNVIVSSARGEVRAVAVVTKRLKPLTVDGKTIHHIGLPLNWGYAGMKSGDSANLLTHMSVMPILRYPNTRLSSVM